MERFIALYRGINVGGRNPVKMESLRAMHVGLGQRAVTSFIQSGNIVFSATGSAEKIARVLAAQFVEKIGFAVRVIVVPAARWSAMVRNNPYAKFSAKLPQTVHAGVCDGQPSAPGLQALHKKVGGSETFVVKGELIYLHAPDGLGKSKFAAGMEKAGGVPITLRNWRTIEALWKMLDGDETTTSPVLGEGGDPARKINSVGRRRSLQS